MRKWLMDYKKGILMNKTLDHKSTIKNTNKTHAKILNDLNS